jgi:hypothetical protein
LPLPDVLTREFRRSVFVVLLAERFLIRKVLAVVVLGRAVFVVDVGFGDPVLVEWVPGGTVFLVAARDWSGAGIWGSVFAVNHQLQDCVTIPVNASNDEDMSLLLC